MLNLNMYLDTLQTGALVCTIYKNKKKKHPEGKRFRVYAGRHREKSHVGKEAWTCAYYGGGHRTEVVRNSVKDLMSILIAVNS